MRILAFKICCQLVRTTCTALPFVMSRYCAASLRWMLKSRQPFVSGSRQFQLSLHVALHICMFVRIKIFHLNVVCSRQNPSLHIEVSSRYVDNAEMKLQNYVEKLPAQILLVEKCFIQTISPGFEQLWVWIAGCRQKTRRPFHWKVGQPQLSNVSCWTLSLCESCKVNLRP